MDGSTHFMLWSTCALKIPGSLQPLFFCKFLFIVGLLLFIVYHLSLIAYCLSIVDCVRKNHNGCQISPSTASHSAMLRR